MGVTPDEEKNVTVIKNSIVSGNYFTTGKNEIVIGKKLSEKLDVGIGDKVVLMSTDFFGNMSTDAYRVIGIFQTSFAEFDRTTIYITVASAQKLLNMEGKYSQFAILVKNIEKVREVKSQLSQQIGADYEVLTYADIIPAIVWMIDSYDEMILVYYLIIGLAIIFGIINVMLMSIFERIKELGILMAMGMKNFKIFLMIIAEAFFLSACGTLIGLVIGIGIYSPLSYTGINFSAFAEGLTMVGLGTIIYPKLTINVFLNAALIIPTISVVASIYPAIKAIRLQPVTAIRYV